MAPSRLAFLDRDRARELMFSTPQAAEAVAMHLGQEVELVDEKSYSIMKDMKARGHSIQILNVGYDLVPSHSLTTYINEV